MKNTVFQIRNTASAVPMPSQPITNGSQTIPEMALKNTMSGLRNSDIGRLRPTMKPPMTPVTTPSSAPSSRRHRLASTWTPSSPLAASSHMAPTTSSTAGSVAAGGRTIVQ